MLTNLQNHGVEDVFIACIDNLQGFADEIESVFPTTEVQLCIVHQIRNSHKYLSYKDVKPFMKGLQNVYNTATANQAERSLDQVESNRGATYPKVIESWRKNWPRLGSYFQYNKYIRRIMYTTNIHRRLPPVASRCYKVKGRLPVGRRPDEALIPFPGEYMCQME